MDVSLLPALIRYKSDVEINEYFTFCQLLPTHNTGEDIFNRLNDFITEMKFSRQDIWPSMPRGLLEYQKCTVDYFTYSCCRIICQII
jgi:hypothetical protein